jgi:tRNA/rRNA methyltransferase
MNLAQAVCVVCYELFKTLSVIPAKAGIHQASNQKSGSVDSSFRWNDKLSERKDINEMLNFLEIELERKNFFQVPEKKPGMLVNIRNIFTKNFYTEQEVRTLRGIFNALRK